MPYSLINPNLYSSEKNNICTFDMNFVDQVNEDVTAILATGAIHAFAQQHIGFLNPEDSVTVQLRFFEKALYASFDGNSWTELQGTPEIAIRSTRVLNKALSMNRLIPQSPPIADCGSLRPLSNHTLEKVSCPTTPHDLVNTSIEIEDLQEVGQKTRKALQESAAKCMEQKDLLEVPEEVAIAYSKNRAQEKEIHKLNQQLEQSQAKIARLNEDLRRVEERRQEAVESEKFSNELSEQELKQEQGKSRRLELALATLKSAAQKNEELQNRCRNLEDQLTNLRSLDLKIEQLEEKLTQVGEILCFML